MTQPDHATLVRTVLAELEQAWNAADGERFGAAFTADADFVDIRGSHHRGAPAIAHGHQAIFDTIYAGSVVAFEARAVAQIGDGAVLAVVEARLDAPAGPLQGVNRSTATILLVPEGERWAVRAFHNTLLAS